MRIGTLAQQTGTETVTIRFYERKGLLPEPKRDANGYRRYSQDHAQRLLFIRHCRNMDMGLDEIRALLDYRDHPERRCDQVNDIIDRHLEQIHEKIAHLHQLEQQLKALRQQCNDASNPDHQARTCGILKSLGTCQDGEACEGHAPASQADSPR